MNLLISPFVNALFGFYYLTGNFGWAVIIVTVLIRLLLIPLVLPSLKSAKKMAELQPKLKKLQEKYGKEKEKLAKAQMDLYKEEGINPLSGCLPQIIQIAVLIIFFQAFNLLTNYAIGKESYGQLNNYLIPSFQIAKEFKFDMSFIGSELSQTPAGIFKNGLNWGFLLPAILLFGSGALQYLSAKLMMPAAAKAAAGKPDIDRSAYTKATPEKGDDMMEAMRTQSLYMMPAMTIFIGWSFSLGMLLYWFVNSAVMLGQQLVVGKMDKK